MMYEHDGRSIDMDQKHEEQLRLAMIMSKNTIKINFESRNSLP